MQWVANIALTMVKTIWNWKRNQAVRQIKGNIKSMLDEPKYRGKCIPFSVQSFIDQGVADNFDDDHLVGVAIDELVREGYLDEPEGGLYYRKGFAPPTNLSPY